MQFVKINGEGDPNRDPAYQRAIECSPGHEIMPAMGVTFAGRHHEIYLSDARRTPPEKLKTILRQPVRSAG
ncbi:hypothetical protein [Bradyrhizobium sp. JYMT SZCCT0428]|uniref:hypothetical protein n=1 Tax=Bradyrhizobium sp. JYMT SZCCT0428 TaxID=2807673 RepID=UPI002012A7FF|nr:hypothetical protein [Bradyrhizobium sp. JYMT SZCCT0428]